MSELGGGSGSTKGWKIWYKMGKSDGANCRVNLEMSGPAMLREDV
jgi:hypothetical protein